jgi:hypothetical protein
MPSLDRVVFVRRQSPNWEALTHDYEAGLAVDPSRYRPPSGVPGFPDNTIECIRTWNNTFWINFFRCRHILKSITERSVNRIKNSILITTDRLDELPALVGQTRFLLFFYDDDDWFAPDTFEKLAALDLRQCDIAIFPLVRFGDEIITFVPQEESAHVVIGNRADRTFRYQTNNYGLMPRIALSDHLSKLQDHMLASEYANHFQPRDTYFDVIISATNKTPASASAIDRLPADVTAYRASIRRFVENLRRLSIPDEQGWMIEYIDETIDLFETM